MVNDVGGVGFTPAARPNSNQTVDRLSVARRKAASSGGDKNVLGADFEQLIQSLEKANAHVKSARAYFRNAQSLRAQQNAEPNQAPHVDLSV